MKPQRKWLLAVVLLLLVPFVTSCGLNSALDEEALKEDYYPLYEDCKAHFRNAGTSAQMMEPLAEWGKEQGFTVQRIDDQVLVISATSDTGDPLTESTALQTCLDPAHPDHSAANAAIILTAMKDTPTHGQVSAIFTAKKKGVYTGAQALPAEYLDVDNFVNLEHWYKAWLITSTAATRTYKIEKDLEQAAVPADYVAYELEIRDLEGGNTADRSRKHPNPVVHLGDFTSDLMGAHIELRMVSLEGGAGAESYVPSAKAVVVMPPEAEKRFLSRFESDKKSYVDKWVSREPDIKYTCTRIDTPALMITDADASRILSLFTTIDEGVYRSTKTEDEEDGEKEDNPVSIANIGVYRAVDGKLTMRVIGRGMENDMLNELDEIFASAAELADCTCTVTDRTPAWIQDGESLLVQRLIAAGEQSGLSYRSDRQTFQKSECSCFREKKKDLDIVSIGTNIDCDLETTKALALMLESMAGGNSLM